MSSEWSVLLSDSSACGCFDGRARTYSPAHALVYAGQLLNESGLGWAVDLFDATTDGRPIKLVSIIDEHTRECLANLVDRTVTADTLIDELDRLALTRGYPAVVR